MPDKSKTNKASKFRMMRPVEGQHVFGQPEGSVSTHISSVFESDGKYFVAPTITNKKAPYAGYQPQSFGEAYRAGEAIPFDSFDEAMFFSQNYKLPKYPRPSFENGGETDPLTNPYPEDISAKTDTTGMHAYYNPPIHDFSVYDRLEDYGDNSYAGQAIDFLYRNPQMFDLPIIGDIVRNQAYKYASQSSNPLRYPSEYPEERGTYEGGQPGDDYASHWNDPEVLKQYFTPHDEKTLNKATYKPVDDYYEFLPTYSVKGNFETSVGALSEQGTPVRGFERKYGKEYTPTNFTKYFTDELLKSKDVSYEDFIKNKKPVFGKSGVEPDSGGSWSSDEVGADMELFMNTDYGAHKQGLGWDKEVGLPYFSVADAWDFEPTNYAKKWANDWYEADESGFNQEQKSAYIQASLMHKAGYPYKMYDRYYFDPKTREYITDENIKSRRAPTKKYGGSMKKFKYDNGGKGSKTYLDSQRERITGAPIIPGMNFESDATMFGSPLLDPRYMQMMLDNQPGNQAPFDYRSIMNEDLYLDNVRKKPTTDFDAFLRQYQESGIDDRAYGGKADVDYEAEDGEVVIGNISVNKAYNGGTAERYKGADMYMLKGARHSDGGIGIKMNGEDPSYIFSDRLNTGDMSYAKAASKFGKDLDEVNQMAMSGDVYDKNTAERMSPRIMAEVKDLYDAQESYKKKQGIGQDPDKMLLGGLVGGLTKLGAGAGLGPAGVAAQFLPGILNMGKGLFGKKPKVDLGTYEPIMQEYQDFSPLERTYSSQQDRSLATLQASLGQTGATGQQLRAGVQAGHAGAQAGASQFYNQLGAMEMQNKASVDSANIAEEQKAQQMNMQLRAQEAQMEANLDPRQSFGKGLSQILGTATSLGQQDQKMKMFNKMFPAAYGGQFGLRKKY